MSVELLSFKSLVSPKSLYLVGFSSLLGASVWVTFVGGIIAFRTLPRQQFGNLQHKTFPIYFSLSLAISTGLLGYWTISNPVVLQHYLSPRLAPVAQAWALLTVILAQSLNYFVIGPITSKTMFQRHKLEKAEGKSYNEAGVSAEMKALNKRFGALHGISSLLNLGAVIALTFHGLWLGSRTL